MVHVKTKLSQELLKSVHVIWTLRDCSQLIGEICQTMGKTPSELQETIYILRASVAQPGSPMAQPGSLVAQPGLLMAQPGSLAAWPVPPVTWNFVQCKMDLPRTDLAFLWTLLDFKGLGGTWISSGLF